MARMLMVATIPSTLNVFLSPLAQHFRAKGWRVDAMANGISDSSPAHETFDRVWEVKWSRNPLDPSNLLTAPKAIRKLVERERYDIVHVHTPVAAFVTRFALRNLRQPRGLKVVYTAHGFHFYQGAPFYKNLVFLGLEKLAAKWMDVLVVINREDEVSSQRHHLVPQDRVLYMPGIGVDTSLFSCDNVSDAEVAQVRAQLGLLATDTLFLMIAEFNPGKHHEDALMALARLNVPTAHLAFAGSGHQMEAIKALSVKLGIADRTHFLGFRRDIPTLLRAAAATMLPSEREGLSRCILESMSMAVPVIGTDVRGIRDLIADGCGQLVGLRDVDGLARAMSWVIECSEEARTAGVRGRQLVAAYDQREIIARHEVLYSKLLSGETADPRT